MSRVQIHGRLHGQLVTDKKEDHNKTHSGPISEQGVTGSISPRFDLNDFRKALSYNYIIIIM